ncbi:homeotic protein empty spiracles-like [Armigeres subalbatus]|uniref:homeotic protein empty spiracles-like n=1 Tax=Armigeres subalbatus TaxID=124917 RepID=UPI002ED57F6E
MARVIISIMTLVVTATAQNVIQVPPPNLQQIGQPEYTPIQPFNIAPDGFYGFNPYSNAIGPPQQVPFAVDPYNSIAPSPYNYPVPANAHPAFQNQPFPQFPGFPQLPQFFPQFPGPFQPGVQSVIPPHAIQQGPPQANPLAAVSYMNFQTQQATQPPQPLRPAIAPAQGVNGLPKPVSTPNVNSNNQAYGSSYGMYVPAGAAPSEATATTTAAEGSTKGARYEAVSGDTVHTATLPGHEKDYKVVSGHAAPVDVAVPVSKKQ